MRGGEKPEAEPAESAHARLRPATLPTSARTEDELRAAWRTWMGERLPAAARAHPEWPIRLDHCFGRVVLDSVYGRPWREALRPPAWRNMDREALEAAVALAERIADGRADLAALNRRSLEMRGKARR